MIVYINPLNQRIIWKDVRMGYEGNSCMDRLTLELKFKKTEESIKGTPEELLEKACKETKFKRKQWVAVEVEEGFKMEEIWKEAMNIFRLKVMK